MLQERLRACEANAVIWLQNLTIWAQHECQSGTFRQHMYESHRLLSLHVQWSKRSTQCRSWFLVLLVKHWCRWRFSTWSCEPTWRSSSACQPFKSLVTQREPSWSFMSDWICLCRAPCLHTQKWDRAERRLTAYLFLIKKTPLAQLHDQRAKPRKLSSMWHGPY